MADVDLRRAAETISVSQTSDLMIVDKEKNFLGVLSEGDLIQAVLPNFDEIIEAGGTLNDAFRFFLEKGRELADQPIAPLILKNCLTVNKNEEVAAVATIMINQHMRVLPVVHEGKLVGTISRSDICRAVLYHA
jgi:CBS domain-containing protein